jgi:SAM-dependent methyltransferase
MRAAIELDLFTAVGSGASSAQAIADRVKASPRGVRALADFLVTLGLLTGKEGSYALGEDAAFFLDKRSPAYLGAMVGFIHSPTLTGAFDKITEAVRKGGTAVDASGTLAPEHPCWVEFARSMAPMARLTAMLITEALGKDGGPPPRDVLDIAAGHGAFGITLAQRFPELKVTALDWPNVLEVAKENAREAKVSERLRTIAGSAFEKDLGGPYDLVLLTNFLHHFDIPTCTGFLKKVRAALRPGGRAVILEFVPDESRTSPPDAARFSLVMLVSTPAGNAYTFREYQGMLKDAGFAGSELVPLPPTPQALVVARA